MWWGPWCRKNWSYQSASQIRTSWWCSVSLSSASVIHECAINDSAANGIAQWTLFSLMQCLDELGLCLCLSSYQEVRHCNHEIYVSWSFLHLSISHSSIWTWNYCAVVMIAMLLIAMREWVSRLRPCTSLCVMYIINFTPETDIQHDALMPLRRRDTFICSKFIVVHCLVCCIIMLSSPFIMPRKAHGRDHRYP